ncbi:MAG TPA: hypothetical protein VKR31_13610 [Rhizomicrobium sp.]|nr:hypothetical protein [Rhizomicrobium sp.]
MDAFSYLLVLVSIVVGLALTHLLAGLAAMVRARRRIAVYWPLAAQMALLFFLQVQMWWAFFGLHAIRSWSFPEFLVVLMQAVLVYLATAILVPDMHDAGRIDLKASYYRETRWYFGALFLAVLDSLAKNLVLTGRLQNGIDLAAHIVFLSVCLGGMATRREWVHKTIAVAALLVFASYIVLLFIPLPR